MQKVPGRWYPSISCDWGDAFSSFTCKNANYGLCILPVHKEARAAFVARAAVGGVAMCSAERHLDRIVTARAVYALRHARSSLRRETVDAIRILY